MRLTWILLPVIVVAAIAAGLLFVRSQTRAIQNPVMSFDMDITGNVYDETTNSMTVGAIDNCLTSAVANPATHIHNVHLVIQNVEDLVGWQARMRYIGDQFRPNTVNFMPFTDNTTGQSISFLNLPIESGVHRDQVTATTLPPGAPGPQSALVGSVYNGTQTFAVSPDTPAKLPADDTSYTITGGGVLASIILQVVGDQSNQASLFVNLDNEFPNGVGSTPEPPGSTVQVFTPTGVTNPTEIKLLPQGQLGDAFHGEGVTCAPQDCSNVECPGGQQEVGTPTPTPGPETPTPTLAPGQTPGPATRTATARPGTPTRTATPAGAGALPDTGGGSPGPDTLTYVVLFGTALAVAGSGTAFAFRCLRKDEPD